MAKNTLKIQQNNEKYKYFERVLPKKCCFDGNKKYFFDVFRKNAIFCHFMFGDLRLVLCRWVTFNLIIICILNLLKSDQIICILN